MSNPVVGTDKFGNPIDAQGAIVPQPGINVAVGRDSLDRPIDADGHIVPQPGPALGRASVTTQNLKAGPAPALTPSGHPDFPPVVVSHVSVDGVSIHLPKGAAVNANGSIILADGTPVNPLDIIRAWRNGQTHL